MEINTINEKRCSKCHEIKPLCEFGKKTYNKDGLNHYCLVCERARTKASYAKPEVKERKKYYQIQKLYGLTKDEYLLKLSNQNHKCAICNNDLLNDKNTHVDHCHTTGAIRDILCGDCNHILGIVEEDAEYLNKVLHYLHVHKSVYM